MTLDALKAAWAGVDWGAIGRALSDPRDDPRTSAILYAILAVCVLIVLLLAYLVVSSPKRGGQGNTAPSTGDAPEQRRASAFPSLLLSVLVVPVLLVAAMNVATHVPAYCTSCHQMQEAHESWHASTHGNVSCVRCHARPGVLGEIEGALWGLGMVVSYGKEPDRPAPTRATVPEGGCRRCHRGVMHAPVGTRTRVPHDQVADLQCAACHLRTGHEPGTRIATTAMNVCTAECHREGGQSTLCETCHPPQAFALDTSGGAVSYPKAAISIRECDGCHPVERCTACHGIYMPHPADFNSGERHARLGFTNKRLCFEQCHTTADCLACHTAVGAHGPGWANTHGATATTGCNHGCHHQHYVMHTRDATPSVDFCDNCHEEYPRF